MKCNKQLGQHTHWFTVTIWWFRVIKFRVIWFVLIQWRRKAWRSLSVSPAVFQILRNFWRSRTRRRWPYFICSSLLFIFVNIKTLEFALWWFFIFFCASKLLITGTEQFNQKPKKGIQILQEKGLLSSPMDNNEVAQWLRDNPRLDKKMIGEFISDRRNTDLLDSFVK